MITLKVGQNKKGEFWRRVQMGSGQRVRFWGESIGFRQLQMLQLGNYGVQVILDRVAKGIGSDDAPMPPLQQQTRSTRWSKSRNGLVSTGAPGYGPRKAAGGGANVRDLNYTGDMLSNLSVRSVSETQVRMDITKSQERMKARANEIRSPWFGWSPRNVANLIALARRLWGEQLTAVGLGNRQAYGSAQIWMNPFAHHYPGSRDAVWATGLRSRIAGRPTDRLRRTA